MYIYIFIYLFTFDSSREHFKKRNIKIKLIFYCFDNYKADGTKYRLF